MMLLQNKKFEGINLSYLHEVKLQIETIIELCKEGEISVFEVEHIITSEWFRAISLESELTQDLDDLRKTETHRVKDIVIIKDEINHVQKMLDIIAEYITVLENDKEISAILLSDDYKQKRKEKIKAQGIISYEDKDIQIAENAIPLQNLESPVDGLEPSLDLPINEVLERLAIGNNPILRKWTNGKYKCKYLTDFIDEYAEAVGENPKKNLIIDYLIKENGEPFTKSTIISTLNTRGLALEKKIKKDRPKKGTHKKDSL